MRAPPGVNLRSLLAGSEYSDSLTRVPGVGSPLFSSATRRLKVAILSLGSSKAYTISSGRAAKSSIEAVSEKRFLFLMSLYLGA